MSIRLLTEQQVWPTIRAAADNSKMAAHVAVAYFGQGAAAMLSLPEGSRLVVDASESAVKSGQTCPAELRKMLKRKVRIFTIQNLHAKVFVVGKTAFIGSANVSKNSANTLVEAVVETTDPAAVKAAKNFVHGLCLQAVGPEMVRKLESMYRPPRLPGGKKNRKSPNGGGGANLNSVRIVQLEYREAPKDSSEAEETGMRAAAKRMVRPRKNKLEDFYWSGACPLAFGNQIIEVLEESKDRRTVSPPGTVVHLESWQGGNRKGTYVFLERTHQRRVSLDKAIKQLGPESKARLVRNGVVGESMARRLLGIWSLQR